MFAVGETESESLVVLVPLQAPDEVQAVAFVETHVSVAGCPAIKEVRLVENWIVGAGGVGTELPPPPPEDPPPPPPPGKGVMVGVLPELPPPPLPGVGWVEGPEEPLVLFHV